MDIRPLHCATEHEALVGDGIAEAAEWIESAEDDPARSAPGKRSIPFSALSDSRLGHWLDERFSTEPKPGSETAGPQADVVHDLLAHMHGRNRHVPLSPGTQTGTRPAQAIRPT